ncbi:MAG: S-methyl-5-thioribose-1-phosphate isomerase [Armatimonadota bacterium]
MPSALRPIYWEDGKVCIIDQTRLPEEKVILTFSDYKDVAQAIRDMRVRGAPAIGVAAALGIALAAQSLPALDKAEFIRRLDEIGEEFSSTRPTAVNLYWAVDRMLNVPRDRLDQDVEGLKKCLMDEALMVLNEDVQVNRTLGAHGAELVDDGDTVLTHCNAGALATAGYGTALGIIRAAVESGKNVKVIVDETRPRLQGMKLTAWELKESRIPVTVITDSMAAWIMKKGMVSSVIVGADRIASNGDTANKVGTYGLAVLARAHNIPFYVAAPLSSVDLTILDGSEIPIEERNPEEVTDIDGKRIAPQGVDVMNPAFDVTPAEYISAIITEEGILRPPYLQTLVQAEAVKSSRLKTCIL